MLNADIFNHLVLILVVHYYILTPAFGCPSMGDEVLEESEFDPMWEDVKDSLDEKKVVLFGSYGWGDGLWMRNWENDASCTILDTFICQEYPDDEAKEACKALGKLIVG